ncbi:putative inactive purple acid phosphatase 29-like protein, partial [Trifolium pratense]
MLSSSSMSISSSGSLVKSNLVTGPSKSSDFNWYPRISRSLDGYRVLKKIAFMIDPYWTVIPVMLVHYYATHPLANYDSWRSKIVIFLTWIWSIRLTHNYFRREKWQWGAREDWRFTEMSEQYGKHWWWISFFAVYVSQQ